MAYSFPEGAAFYFSSTFAGAKTVTEASNANPCLATASSHGYVDGDVVLFTSGWEDATDSCYVVDQQSTDTFLLKGLNSSNTTFYPATSGTGSAYLVSSWVQIPQVLTIGTSGGDARFTNISPLSRRNSIAIPTGFNAASITLSLGHDPDDVNYLAMLDVSRALTKVAFKMTLGGGGTSYGYGYLTVSEVPSLNVNQVNTVTAAFALLNKPVSYAT
jgi:hypothetical protein